MSKPSSHVLGVNQDQLNHGPDVWFIRLPSWDYCDHEHGPQGGDEINILKAGANFGWPKTTFGEQYGGGKIGIGPKSPGIEEPLLHWTPSIAPSGMDFYQGDIFPNWNGDLLVGSLKFRMFRLSPHMVPLKQRVE